MPSGATVERAVPTPLAQGDTLQLDLNTADYSTAREVAKAINARMGEASAQVVDGLGMLLHQAAPGFERWFGHRPEVDDATRAAVLSA